MASLEIFISKHNYFEPHRSTCRPIEYQRCHFRRRGNDCRSNECRAMIVGAMIVGAMIVGAMIVGTMVVTAMIVGAMRRPHLK